MADKVLVPATGDVDIVSLIQKWFPGLGTGNIDNTPIGQTTPAAGSFTTLSSGNLASLASVKLDTGTKTATVAGNLTVTLNKMAGVLTTGNLTTGAGNLASIVMTNSDIAAVDQVFASVANGTNTGGDPTVSSVNPGANTCTINIRNTDASAAFNGTIKISFAVLKN